MLPDRANMGGLMFRKILVANRGEIAIRVMRAANELGKKTVAVYAEEDKLSLHRFKADEAYRIGAGLGPVAAYLSIPEIIRVAKESGADAIHPGYGLLSENPDFVDACVAAGITFIGPSADTMRALGDKASARRVAIAAGVPVIPATEVLGEDMDAIKAEAAGIGYPLMLKASWGGGGRGMRPIFGPEELPENRYYLFGKGGARRFAEEHGVDFLGEIPIVQSIMEGSDEGRPAAGIDPRVEKWYCGIAEKIVEKVMKSC